MTNIVYSGGTQQVLREILSRDNKIEDRVRRLESAVYAKIYFVTNTSPVLNAVAISGTYTSGTMRGVNGVADNAKAIIGTLWAVPNAAGFEVRICASDETPSAASQKLVMVSGTTSRALSSQFVMIPLGTDGAFKLTVTAGTVNVSLNIFGYLL